MPTVGGYWGHETTVNLGTLDASGANTIVFAPGHYFDVKRVILVTTIAQTVVDAIITVAIRDVDDGNSTTKGTFTLAFTGSATDDKKFVDFGKPATTGTTAADGSLIYKGHTPGGVLELKPGQELSLTSDAGGNAGTYQVYVEGYDKGMNIGQVGMTELTFTHA